ncbi:MAG: hypothetical protein RLZZ306_1503 [Bacteroidota bacterium]|jgi:hypothetical protein
MEKINLKAWNRVLLGKDIAMEIEALDEKNRRWLCIYPNLESNREMQTSKIPKNHKYQLFDFELDENLIDTYFGDDDMLNQKRIYVNTEDELYQILSEMNIDVIEFTAPFNCDYPF